jgi:hypothetical protein
LFHEEWRNAIADFDIGAPTHTRYDIADWCAWWRGHNVEVVLARRPGPLRRALRPLPSRIEKIREEN